MKTPEVPKSGRGRRPLGVTPGREALLKVALVQFAKFGYEATSLRNLATAAEVDVALVARLFGSKANLWMAVVDELAIGQVAHVTLLKDAEASCTTDPTESMKSLIKLFAHISYEMPALGSFLMHEMSNPGERLNVLLERLVLPFRQACWPILLAAIQSGVVRSTRPDILFSMLISAIAMPLGSPSLIQAGRTLSTALRDEIAEQAILLILCDRPVPSGR